MVELSILVCTYGDGSWARLAEQRAIPSAWEQAVPVHHVHGETLADARNNAIDIATTDFVVYLDADDELEPGYIDAMRLGSADVRAPRVRYVADGKRWPAPRTMRVAGHFDHDCGGGCLPFGNWIVIGAAVRTEYVRAARWREWPCYEDWDLWLRLHQAGATFERVDAAIYRAHVRPDSRNRGTLTDDEKHAVHQAIARANDVPVPV